MRVNIYQQLDVTDEQKVKIADLLDGKVSKRGAKRDEIKEWVWDQGSNWEAELNYAWNDEFSGDPDLDDEDDLIGDPDLEDLL